MIRLRSLFIWLVVLALPLQGLAAVTMVLCGSAPHHTFVAAEVDSAAASVASTAGHDHTQHDHAAALSSGDAGGLPDGLGKTTPLNHKCGVCASCCHSIAISSSPVTVSAQPLPAADMAEPFVVIHAVPPQALERPPRA